MRVLFVTHNFPRFTGDAAGSFVLRLAIALRDECGIDIEVIAPGTAELSGEGQVEGIPVQRIVYAAPQRMTLAYTGTMAEAVRASFGAKLAFAGLFLALRRASISRISLAKKSGSPFHVVHAQWWFPAGVAVALASLTNRSMPPYMVTMHGSDVRLAQDKSFLHAAMRAVLRRATVSTAVSSWLARTAEAISGVNVQVGPMPVDVERFTPSHTVSRRRAVLFVGRLNEQKGIADLVEAFARIPVASDTSDEARLEVVGDGPDRESLILLASRLGIAARVTWHGAVTHEQLLPLYRECAVVAIPSREEGLGLVAVEAQLCGTPVVAYASGGLPDIVGPEYGGTLVPPGNIPALATALEGWLNDPSRTALQGDARREAMLDRFAPATVAARYAAWYRQVASPDSGN